MLDFVLLTADQTRPFFGTLVDIYEKAFAQPPFNETFPDFFNFAGRLSYHARQPGFRCALARPAGQAPPVGFVYGYNGQGGSWFYKMAAQHLPPALLNEYLSDTFEFAELALLPAWQRHGAGGRLHDLLLDGLPQRTACLMTAEMETHALHLYLKRGWSTLARGIELPGTPLRYQMMGKRLAGG